MAELTDYGKIARDYLEEHDPQEFHRLQRQGKLNAHLVKVQERVSDLIFQTYEGILERNPPPDDQMGIFRANMTAWNQAQDIVLSNEFPPRLPPDEIEDEIPAGPPAARIENRVRYSTFADTTQRSKPITATRALSAKGPSAKDRLRS